MEIRTSFIELPWFKIKSILGFGLVIFLFAASSSQAVEIPKTCPDEPTDMTIHYGDVVDCTIDSIGDSDLFFFEGTVGDTILIHTIRPSGEVEPCIELFASDGTRLQVACSSYDGYDQFRIDRTLDETGPYTIRISDGGNNQVGTYRFSFEKISPLPSNASPIQYGDMLSDMIDFDVDSDLFFFEGTVGDTILIHTVRPSGKVEPCIELFVSDGARLQVACSSYDGYDQFRIDRTLEEKGPYTIRISDGGNNDTGPYNLSFQCIAGPCNSFPEPLLPSRLENISTRGYVGINDERMIAGFIIKGDTPVTVLIRARGPSVNVPSGTIKLANPHLTLNSSGQKITENDDCQDAPNWEQIEATGKAPTDPFESCILITLPPGPHGAVVKGADGGVGIGIVEVLEIND